MRPELRDLYCLTGTTRVMKWMMMISGACGTHGGRGRTATHTEGFDEET